jgi:hypothetical protein
MAEEYAIYKEEHLRRVKDGKGKWTEELASNSEAAVRRLIFVSCLHLQPPFLDSG